MEPTERAAVLVIGAGPAGVGAAAGLARRGVGRVILIDRSDRVGGVPALYRGGPASVPTFVLWTRGQLINGERLAARLAARLEKTSVEVWLESHVTAIFPREGRTAAVSPERGKVCLEARAVVLACGARERSAAERGWITGSRPGGVFFTRNMLDLTARNGVLPARKPVILGSDVLAYAAAAKLAKAGAQDPVVVDRTRRPASSLAERLYFRPWAGPEYRGGAVEASLAGDPAVSAVRLPEGVRVSCDGVILAGDLTPNSELALLAGLQVEAASRRPQVDSEYALSAPGWFAAGNILGHNYGAERSYLNGCRVAGCVARYLSKMGS